MAKRRTSRRTNSEFDGLYDAFEPGRSSAAESGGRDGHRQEQQDEHSGFAYAEHPPRGRRRAIVGCLVPVLVLGGLGYGGYKSYAYLSTYFGGKSCKVASGKFDYQWSAEQLRNASTIATVGSLLEGLPQRASQVALTTAIQESKLRNLNYGDLDSLGLFQQRPSQGWGTAAQIQDPVFASKSFYNALSKISGWQSKSIGQAAQAVQRSGYPTAYDDHETQGQVLAEVFTGTTAGGVGCRLDDASSSTAPAALAQRLAKETSLQATTTANTLSVTTRRTTTAQAAGAWAVAHAESDGVTSVTVGDREWKRQRGKDGWTWQDASKPTGSPTKVVVTLAGR